MITFAVTKVESNPKRRREVSVAQSMGVRANRSFEAAACHASSTLVQSGNTHGFLAAVHAAFDAHYPLVLSPDDVWLCLAQGFAMHVNLHAEALRHFFVQHESKVKIVVRRDDFVKNSPTNDWPGMFAELSDRIADHVGRRRNLFVANFSTTGPIERAASEIVFFDAMQQYFDFDFLTMCGIPEITLLGTIDDWRSIRTRVENLSEFDVPESSHWRNWTAAVLPILDQIIRAVQGSVNLPFWESIYKLDNGSGGPYVSGWVNTLFPYVENQNYHTNKRTIVPNKYALNWHERMYEMFHTGPGDYEFPTGVSSAPFIWNYLGTEFPMMFMGGFAGVAQDPQTGAVRPAIGWAIGEQ